MDHQFRNAAIGGFNRQDVLDYLEAVAKENAQKRQTLEQQLSQTQSERDSLSAQCAEQERQQQELTRQQQERQNSLTQENEALRHSLEQTKAELSELWATAEQQGLELDSSHREAQQLRERLDKLEPDALAYAAVKERSAGVELEAHRRAQGVLDQANAQARQLRQQMDQWLARMGRAYDDLRGQVDATISHAAGELGQVQLTLEAVTQSLADQDAALETLTRAYEETDGEKIPAPMPIPEG